MNRLYSPVRIPMMTRNRTHLIITGLILLLMSLLSGFQYGNDLILQVVEQTFRLNPDPAFWGAGLQYVSFELLILSLVLFMIASGVGVNTASFTGLLLLCTYFSYRLFTNALNVPIMDDFRSVLIFFSEFTKADDIHQ